MSQTDIVQANVFNQDLNEHLALIRGKIHHIQNTREYTQADTY